MRRPTMTILAVAALLVAGACGGDDDVATDTTATAPAAATSGSGAPPVATVTAAPTSPTTGAPPTTAAVAIDPDAEAASVAWTTAFDSALGYDAKAAYIVDADALRPTIEAYTGAGEAVGGIALEPTSVVVSGDTATVTYDVLFAGQPAYQDQDGTIQRVDGTWKVSREEFCGFMGAARNPCPP